MPLTPLVRTVDAALEATVVLSFTRVGHQVRARLADWQPVGDLPGGGRTVVVTGANSGLGYAAARALLDTGARVVAVARTEDKARATAQRLRNEGGDDATVGHAWGDLTDLSEVRALAERLQDCEPRIDALIHNAGAMFTDRLDTVDGFERTYQVHVVAPFLLTALLLPTLTASAPARVITVTSGGMYAEKLDVGRLESPDEYRPTSAYARAKRAQVVLTAEAQRRLGRRGVDLHVVHPGWALTPGIESSLPGFRRVVGPLLRDPNQGADTAAWLALTDDRLPAGRLWLDRRPRSPHKVPWTWPAPGEAEELWRKVAVDAGVVS